MYPKWIVFLNGNVSKFNRFHNANCFKIHTFQNFIMFRKLMVFQKLNILMVGNVSQRAIFQTLMAF